MMPTSLEIPQYMCHSSSVSIVTGSVLDHWNLIPNRGLCFHQHGVNTCSGTHPTSYPRGNRVLSRVVKRQGV